VRLPTRDDSVVAVVGEEVVVAVVDTIGVVVANAGNTVAHDSRDWEHHDLGNVVAAVAHEDDAADDGSADSDHRVVVDHGRKGRLRSHHLAPRVLFHRNLDDEVVVVVVARRSQDHIHLLRHRLLLVGHPVCRIHGYPDWHHPMILDFANCTVIAIPRNSYHPRVEHHNHARRTLRPNYDPEWYRHRNRNFEIHWSKLLSHLLPLTFRIVCAPVVVVLGTNAVSVRRLRSRPDLDHRPRNHHHRHDPPPPQPDTAVDVAWVVRRDTVRSPPLDHHHHQDPYHHCPLGYHTLAWNGKDLVPWNGKDLVDVVIDYPCKDLVDVTDHRHCAVDLGLAVEVLLLLLFVRNSRHHDEVEEEGMVHVHHEDRRVGNPPLVVERRDDDRTLSRPLWAYFPPCDGRHHE